MPCLPTKWRSYRGHKFCDFTSPRVQTPVCFVWKVAISLTDFNRTKPTQGRACIARQHRRVMSHNIGTAGPHSMPTRLYASIRIVYGYGYSQVRRTPASPLRELTCHMGSHSITCHPAELTFPPLPQPKLVLD